MNRLRAKLLKLLKDFIRLFKNKLDNKFSLTRLSKKFKLLKLKKFKTMQTAMANNNTNNQLITTSCTSPPCTPSPCNSPINVTNLSDHSNHSIRESPINQIIKTTLINTTTINTNSATNLLNQVVALSSPLSTSPTASLSSSPSSSLASPIALDCINVNSNEKFSTADLLQQTQHLNNSIKSLTQQAKARTNGNTIKDEKNGKVSNFFN